MKHLIYLSVTLFASIHTLHIKSADQKQATENAMALEIEKLKKVAIDDPYKYFRNADLNTMATFEAAYIMGNKEIVEEMLADKKVSSADAGLVVIDNSLNETISHDCIAVIAQKDPYALWETDLQLRAEAKLPARCIHEHPGKEHMDRHFPTIPQAQKFLDLGFIIPQKARRFALESGHSFLQGDYEKFYQQYMPILHYLVSTHEHREGATFSAIDKLTETLLKSGANPYQKTDCWILSVKENLSVKEKIAAPKDHTPVDVFTLIERNSTWSPERKTAVAVLCRQHSQDPTTTDTENQFFPGTTFYRAIKKEEQKQ